MVSRIACENKSDYNELHYAWDLNARCVLDYKEQRRPLSKIFPTGQLRLIELAFEEGSGAFYSDCDTDDAAVKFGRKFRSKKGRLLAIMENIVANKGTFKP